MSRIKDKVYCGIAIVLTLSVSYAASGILNNLNVHSKSSTDNKTYTVVNKPMLASNTENKRDVGQKPTASTVNTVNTQAVQYSSDPYGNNEKRFILLETSAKTLNDKKDAEEVNKSVQQTNQTAPTPTAKPSSTTQVTDISQSKISAVANAYYSQSNARLLAKLINSEAGDQSYAGQVAVGYVVLYRSMLNHDTIQTTIYAPFQFSGVTTPNFKEEPDASCIKASTEVLSSQALPDDSYFFIDKDIMDRDKKSIPDWASDSKFIKKIGGHSFYRK